MPASDACQFRQFKLANQNPEMIGSHQSDYCKLTLRNTKSVDDSDAWFSPEMGGVKNLNDDRPSSSIHYVSTMAEDNDNDNGPLATQVADGADNIHLRCSRRGCKREDGGEVLCGNVDCGRVIHPDCFNMLYIQGKGLTPLENEKVACTKKCYDKIKVARNRRPQWDEDGANGKDDPNNSERILMDWILSPGNYSKYRGKNNDGVKKNQFALKIAQKCNAAGVKVTRDAKQVINKIKWLEDGFRDADRFVNSETGAGIKDNDPQSFEEKVEGICKYYYDLLPVMGDRAGNKPKKTSDDLPTEQDVDDLLRDNPDDEEEEEGKEDEVDPSTDPSANTGVARSSSAAISSAAGGKRSRSASPTPWSSGKKTGRVVSLLDQETQASIRNLTETRKESTALEIKQREMDIANRDLEYCLGKLDKVAMIRKKYPFM
jgi:hypothetical protein